MQTEPSRTNNIPYGLSPKLYAELRAASPSASAAQLRYARHMLPEVPEPWKPKDERELCSLYGRLRYFEKRYPQDAALKSSLQALEHRVGEVQKELHGEKQSTFKKILLTLGLTFLSACTVRYWLNKFEPFLDDYAIKYHASAQASQGTIPLQHQVPYAAPAAEPPRLLPAGNSGTLQIPAAHDGPSDARPDVLHDAKHDTKHDLQHDANRRTQHAVIRNNLQDQSRNTSPPALDLENLLGGNR